jgi:hypothetical protein
LAAEPNSNGTSDLAVALQEVSEKAQLLVREEIELAKAEVSTKIAKLAKGAAVGAAAGVFVLAGLIYFLHAMSWLIWKWVRAGGDDNFYLGFLIVAVALFLIAGLAGFLAYRFVRSGSPPTPKLAIEEAHRIRETVAAAQRTDPGRSR